MQVHPRLIELTQLLLGAQRTPLASCRHYLTLLGEQEQPLQGQNQRAAVDAIRADFENIGVAWRWAVQKGEFALLAPAVHALFLYCEVSGNFLEGVTLFTIAAAELTSAVVANATNQATLQPRLRQVLVRLGTCEVMVDSRHDSAVNNLQQGLRYVMADRERAFALAYLGRTAIARGEWSLGRAELHESLALSRQCRDPGLTAQALYMLTNGASEYTEAIHQCEESLTLWRTVGRPDRIAEVLNFLAWHICCLGDYEKATTYWQEGMEICTTLGIAASHRLDA